MIKTRTPYSRPIDHRRRAKLVPRKWKNDTTANLNPFCLFEADKICAARRGRYQSESFFLYEHLCQSLANHRNTERGETRTIDIGSVDTSTGEGDYSSV